MTTWSGSIWPGSTRCFHLGYRDLRRGRHHGVEIARGFAVNKVAEAIAFPCFDQREVRGESAFEQVETPVEFAHLFPLGHDGACARGSVEGRDARACRTDALSKRTLGDQGEIQLPRNDQSFEKFVFANVTAEVGSDLAG